MPTLRELLARPECLVAPGIYDLISARVAADAGAEVLYMTGYGTVASHLGLPDAGLASFRDMVNRVAAFAVVAEEYGIPLIADGDTGYGGLLNVDYTVKEYERAGASAIQLEDQVFPKKCGHTPGRAVIPLEDMVQKIEVAAEARRSDDFLIIARTDARTVHGFDAALERVEAFDKAGADILFLESPESEEELARVASHFKKPVLANMVEGGRTPVLTRDRLTELGFSIALFPAIGFLSAGRALDDAYRRLIHDGQTVPTQQLYPFNDFSKLMGFQRVWDFDAKHARD
ncbi:carboxyvinyl-carboxyphosphonate phosphorylmutase [Acuticoccus sediminis]|uniref:Carboxyvinyl-carboxyphosphonate phosphorylmutase n=1 Tax=Acuticoccus sediminis TaxID=2184697 RepID=A0A8B2NQS3_9HYPH|nr:isocitrate lyase/PEP mutase family protein [Acuticoccus sediminis]RAH99562.1 carboxyvinyl-carboxyphosphonate phosphorylmutase [Acuticoccus sediminis]